MIQQKIIINHDSAKNNHQLDYFARQILECLISRLYSSEFIAVSHLFSHEISTTLHQLTSEATFFILDSASSFF